MIKADEFRE
jgi:hypothetical protein